MRKPVLAAVAVLVTLAALLAGCAAIPSSGSVNAGKQPGLEEPPELDAIVAGPEKGYTQEQILQGFLDAAASSRDNYQIAQRYLTPAFADEWAAGLPAATIDSPSDRDLEPVDDTTWQVEATPVASLTAAGQYDVQDSSAPIALTYGFEQVEGEWRISLAPPGLLIDETTFSQVFRQHSLYFFDPEYEYLVPDLRWFAGRDSVQTSIVNALIAGPVDWLEPGVVSAFPEGVQLDPASVPVAGREASVNLAGAAFDDLVSVQRMHLQLEASLGSVRSIENVALSLGGARQDVPDLASPPVLNPPVDRRPVVFDGEAFGHLATSGEGIEPIPGLSPQIAELAPTGVALGPAGESAAVRSAGGVSLVRVDEEPKALDPRSNLVVPAIDVHGGVWSVPADSPGELVWYPSEGEAKPMGAPWSGTSIAALEVSRDGTRIAAILGDGARTHFMAVAVERDADGVPVALGTVTLRLADIAGTPLDVAWLDSSTVASLTALPGGGTRVITQDLGGRSDITQGPEGGEALDGGNGDVRVLTSADELYARSGVGWQVRASGIRLVAAQQPR
ncbi:LpqB family beta-propeller domain-containing protein [Agromyces ramosus]|uniref:GerMN domain-containing protein n=1 Tax=Agromyces ramosus TaxID=33879 RepID=A0ABU0RBK4_9MICO|nr:LpqB family beta-propeller domain-containing protein [Agromyces ramosus]MDQ0895453.1 hypothetical protein [Agromyces ramosus]